MKIVLDTVPKNYLSNMRTRFDSRLMLGQERYIGWTVGNLFSVRYYSGKEFGRRNYPIANKAMGFVTYTENKTVVYYCSFQGLTDPISLAGLFMLTLLIFSAAGAPCPVLFTLCWVAAAAVTTWVCTWASDSGQEGSKKIGEFLRCSW